MVIKYRLVLLPGAKVQESWLKQPSRYLGAKRAELLHLDLDKKLIDILYDPSIPEPAQSSIAPSPLVNQSDADDAGTTTIPTDRTAVRSGSSRSSTSQASAYPPPDVSGSGSDGGSTVSKKDGTSPKDVPPLLDVAGSDSDSLPDIVAGSVVC